jgi:heptosyltransferase-2
MNPIRILVIRGGGLGDFLLILPVLRALRKHWPSSRLEILGNPPVAELVLETYADAVQSIDQAEFARFFLDPSLRALGSSRLSRYVSSFDLSISFLPDRQRYLERNIEALGPRCLTIPPPQGTEIHAAEQFLRGLEPLGVRGEDATPKVPLAQGIQTQADQMLIEKRGQPDCPLVAIHCGSGSPRKNWAAQNFGEVCCWLRDTGRFEITLVQGAADRVPTATVKTALAPHYPLLLKDLPLTTLSGVLSRCCLLLGNDSGISHLAAAVGTPVLALFGPTSPQVWRPLNPSVRVLGFTEATPERVKEVLREVLMF